MQNAAAGWLMTGLDPDPLTVALVQVATTLPMFLLGIPAGALADILDRRRLLLIVQLVLAVLVAGFSLLVWLDRITPAALLGFTFLMGAGAALIAPAWQSIVPQLVSHDELSPAVAANSVGINVSRAVGPALAGFLIGALGIAAPFWINALTSLGVIAALIWWRPQQAGAHQLPPERFGSAMLIGLRLARRNPHLRATLIRAIYFFVFASAYWADLPILARNQVRMLLRLEQAYGLDPDPRERAPEILATVAAGLGLRAVVRGVLDVIPPDDGVVGLLAGRRRRLPPVAGWAVQGGIAYTGTRALGEAAFRRLEMAQRGH